MDEEEEKKQGFKIEDKRRFDKRGNVREGEKEAKGAQRSEAPSDSGPSEGQQAEKINFSSFVMSLATQALIQLGEMPPPEGFEISPDRNAARQTIDILSLLEEKTKGNLEPEEAHLLKEILHTLRISYVRSK